MMGRKFSVLMNTIQRTTPVRAVRDGLTSMIPVLTIGAFALILQTFPLAAYQTFIAALAGGLLVQLFQLVYSATFGVLSVYMTYSISRAYMKLSAGPEVVRGGAVLSSLISFFLLAGAELPTFSTDSMGPKSMFLALLTGLAASLGMTVLAEFVETLEQREALHQIGCDQYQGYLYSPAIPLE